MEEQDFVRGRKLFGCWRKSVVRNYDAMVCLFMSLPGSSFLDGFVTNRI